MIVDKRGRLLKHDVHAKNRHTKLSYDTQAQNITLGMTHDMAADAYAANSLELCPPTIAHLCNNVFTDKYPALSTWTAIFPGEEESSNRRMDTRIVHRHKQDHASRPITHTNTHTHTHTQNR